MRRDAIKQSDEVERITRCTRFMLHMQSQVRLYHWQTRSYARHRASDELLASLSDLADRFIESLIGNEDGVRPASVRAMSPLKDFDDDDIKTFLLKSIKFLTNVVPRLVREDAALLSIRDEIVTVLQRTIYLMTFI